MSKHLEQNNNRKIRESRHFLPANKEWRNSTYNYNNKHLSDIVVKDVAVNSLVKGYFNLVPKSKYVTKSKRMRDLLRSKSTEQLFVSRPEIKQTNDKAIITVYTFDRQKQKYARKLFLLRRWLNQNIYSRENLNVEKSNLILPSSAKLMSKYDTKFLSLKFRHRKKRFLLRRYISKYNLKYDTYRNVETLLMMKKQTLSTRFFFYFIRWVLLILNIRVRIVVKDNLVSLILTKKESNNTTIRNKTKPSKIVTINEKFNLKTLNLINIILLQYTIVNTRIYYESDTNVNKIYSLYRLFVEKYYRRFVIKHLEKEMLIIKYMSKLLVNNYKYHSYISGIKNMLSKVYNKKIQLNIVNLKYLHLNSDMYSEAISIKLKDRTRSLFRVFLKSFKLIKTLKPNNMFILEQSNKNATKEISTYFGKHKSLNGNTLNTVFKNMFQGNTNDNKKVSVNLNTNSKDILNNIKYKWITGVRIETKGRLTKRYAASRALFKYKYRGSLKNMEYLNNKESDMQSSSVFMMRGYVRPNTQYSFVPSKRRIGAFGIKGWISNS